MTLVIFDFHRSLLNKHSNLISYIINGFCLLSGTKKLQLLIGIKAQSDKYSSSVFFSFFRNILKLGFTDKALVGCLVVSQDFGSLGGILFFKYILSLTHFDIYIEDVRFSIKRSMLYELKIPKYKLIFRDLNNVLSIPYVDFNPYL